MKRISIFILSLLFVLSSEAQTTTTLSALRKMTTANYTTVYRVNYTTDTVFYRRVRGVTAPDDGDKIIRGFGDVTFAKLVPVFSVITPEPTVEFTPAQTIKILQMIEDARKGVIAKQIADSLTDNQIIFSGTDFANPGGKGKPIIINRTLPTNATQIGTKTPATLNKKGN